MASSYSLASSSESSSCSKASYRVGAWEGVATSSAGTAPRGGAREGRGRDKASKAPQYSRADIV